MRAANPMIQAAIDAGESTTGFCTVREVAEALLAEPRYNPLEMVFSLHGIPVRVTISVAVR